MKKAHPKRIAFLGPAHPYRGGIASFSQRLALEFQAQGWDVKCFTFTYQYPRILFPGKNQYSEDKSPELDIERVVHSINPVSWRKAKKKLKAFAPYILVAPHWNPLMSWSSSYLMRQIDANHVILVHNLFPHERRIFDKYFINKITSVNATFVTISSFVYRQMLNHYPKKKVTLSDHPIYDHYGDITSKAAAAQYLDLDPDYNYLLFFGLVRGYKGLGMLLETMKMLKESQPKLKLLVVGEFYQPRKIYDSMIKNYGLEQQVHIYDSFVKDTEIAPYFNISDAVVLPYLHGTQSGIGRIATHFLKPIIVTNVGSLADQTKEGKLGKVVEPNAKALANGIQTFYEEQHDYQSDLYEEKAHNTWRRLYNHIVNQVV